MIELDENVELPANSKCWITEISIPTSWKTTEVGFFEKLYYMLYDNSNTLLRNGIIDLSNKVYFAEQLSFDMVSKLNDAVRDLNSGNDIFVYAYPSATRSVEIKVADGLNFKLRIPTDEELANYVDNTWASGQNATYNNTNPKSINYLLSNYIATNGGLSTWTSSYLNLVPFRSVFITCNELSDGHYASPNSYSSSIVKKVLIDRQLGGVVNDTSTSMSEDFIDVSNRHLKKLSFRITDSKHRTMNLYDLPVEFSLLFSTPHY